MHSVILCREGGIAVITVLGFPQLHQKKLQQKKSGGNENYYVFIKVFRYFPTTPPTSGFSQVRNDKRLVRNIRFIESINPH